MCTKLFASEKNDVKIISCFMYVRVCVILDVSTTRWREKVRSFHHIGATLMLSPLLSFLQSALLLVDARNTDSRKQLTSYCRRVSSCLFVFGAFSLIL